MIIGYNIAWTLTITYIQDLIHRVYLSRPNCRQETVASSMHIAMYCKHNCMAGMQVVT